MSMLPKKVIYAQIPTDKGLLKIYLLKDIYSNNKNENLVWARGPHKVLGMLHSWLIKTGMEFGKWPGYWVYSHHWVRSSLFLCLTIMLTLVNLASSSIALVSDKHLLLIPLCFASLFQFTHCLCFLSVAATLPHIICLMAFSPVCILASAPCHQPVTLYVLNSDWFNSESKCRFRIKGTRGLKFELHEGKPHALRPKGKRWDRYFC